MVHCTIACQELLHCTKALGVAVAAPAIALHKALGVAFAAPAMAEQFPNPYATNSDAMSR
jgi:hypothetical protein